MIMKPPKVYYTIEGLFGPQKSHEVGTISTQQTVDKLFVPFATVIEYPMVLS